METKRLVFRIIVGIVKFLLKVRNMFVLIFNGVALLILYFAMKLKLIFSIQFFLDNSFYF